MQWDFKKGPNLEQNVSNFIDKIGEWLVVLHKDDRFPCLQCARDPSGVCPSCLGTGKKTGLFAVRARISYDVEVPGSKEDFALVQRETPTIHFPAVIRPNIGDIVYTGEWIINQEKPINLICLREGYKVIDVIKRHNGEMAWWHSNTQPLNQNSKENEKILKTRTFTIVENKQWQKHLL